MKLTVKRYMSLTPVLIVVRSSFIQAVGHDATRNELYVQFKSGLYRYTGVKAVTATRLLNAPSKGKFFHRNIRGQYPTTRLGD